MHKTYLSSVRSTRLTHWLPHQTVRDPPLISGRYLEYFRASKSTKINHMRSNNIHKIRFQDFVYLSSINERANVKEISTKITQLDAYNLYEYKKLYFFFAVWQTLRKLNKQKRVNFLLQKTKRNRIQQNFYQAVFISKLTCQLSSFFVQNFVQTKSTLCKERRQLCTKNVNFARTTTTLQGQWRLCKDNVHFARTTTTLQGQWQLCKDNDDFARTTTTLS